MPIDGYTYGRGLKFHAHRFNNCKRKQKQKNIQTLHIRDVPFALHVRGGPAAPAPCPANQGQNPAGTTEPQVSASHRAARTCPGEMLSSPAASQLPRCEQSQARFREDLPHVNKYNRRADSRLLTTGKSVFKLGHKKPYTICINSE